MTDESERFISRVRPILRNPRLAEALWNALDRSLATGRVHAVGYSPSAIFDRSLDAAIRDIQQHPRGKLLQRFLVYGPASWSEPPGFIGDGSTQLSDEECGTCIRFIFSHMINRFKGELAELLGLQPVAELTNGLVDRHEWPATAAIYWGEMTTARHRSKSATRDPLGDAYAKGPDGIVIAGRRPGGRVFAVVEVKSTHRPWARIEGQLERHLERLSAGFALSGVPSGQLRDSESRSATLIAVRPSSWTLPRTLRVTDKGLLLPTCPDPPVTNIVERVGPKAYRITLAWSDKAISEAAFNMTFWYMAAVGAAAYEQSPIPTTWRSMTPTEVGENATKQAFDFALSRPLSPNQFRDGTRLYNYYCYGFVIAKECKEFLGVEEARELACRMAENAG